MEKFVKKKTKIQLFVPLNMQKKNIWKIDKILGTRIETGYKTRTRDKLNMRVLPFFYLTIGNFTFFKHFEGFRRLSKNCLFKSLWKWQKLRSFTSLKRILVRPISVEINTVINFWPSCTNISNKKAVFAFFTNFKQICSFASIVTWIDRDISTTIDNFFLLIGELKT